MSEFSFVYRVLFAILIIPSASSKIGSRTRSQAGADRIAAMARIPQANNKFPQ
jgi:hypothetical protein